MEPDPDREIEGEVTRVEAVRYLEGGVGHAVGSTLFVLGGGYLFLSGQEPLSAYVFAIAFLVSGNGLSIWAWARLQSYFAARAPSRDESAETRSLRARPISPRSRVTLLAGAVMVPTLVTLLVLGVVAVQLLGPQTAGWLFVSVLVLGNAAAIGNAYFGWGR